MSMQTLHNQCKKPCKCIHPNMICLCQYIQTKKKIDVSSLQKSKRVVSLSIQTSCKKEKKAKETKKKISYLHIHASLPCWSKAEGIFSKSLITPSHQIKPVYDTLSVRIEISKISYLDYFRVLWHRSIQSYKNTAISCPYCLDFILLL